MDNKDLTLPEFLDRAKVLLIFSMVGVLILGILILMLGNEDLFLWVNQFLTPKFGAVSKVLTKLGTFWPMAWLLAISYRRELRKMLAVLLTWLFGACLSWLFKLWLMQGALRPFPYFGQKGIALNVVEGVDIHHYNTFPSGHTLTAFSALLVYAYVRNEDFKLWQVAVLWFLAIGCGISRLVLVQHWPTDVLGGIFLGILAALLAVWVSIRLPQRELFNRSLLSFFPF